MDIKGILFDKDGTLIDIDSMWVPVTKKVIDNLLMELRIEGRRDLTEELMNSIGINNDKIISNAILACKTATYVGEEFAKVLLESGYDVDFEKVKRLTVDYFNHYAADKSIEIKEIVDLKALLSGLKSKNLLIGMSTADTKESAKFCLNKLGIIDYFDFIGADDGITKAKPEPELLEKFCNEFKLEKNQVAIVGDTNTDLDFAKNAGAAMAIGVLSGACRVEDLKDRADTILNTVGELIIDNRLIWE